jgi:hypothetical protein
VPGLHTLWLLGHVPQVQAAFVHDILMGAVYLVRTLISANKCALDCLCKVGKRLDTELCLDAYAVGGGYLCLESARALVAGRLRFSFQQSSAFPCLCCGRCPGALSWSPDSPALARRDWRVRNRMTRNFGPGLLRAPGLVLFRPVIIWEAFATIVQGSQLELCPSMCRAVCTCGGNWPAAVLFMTSLVTSFSS